MSLGNRMKHYENISRNYLTSKIPMIIRLDGKSFHSITKGFEKPFDEVFIKCMQETTLQLMREIPQCVFSYTQSDEISLLILDNSKITSESWFGKNINKIVSVSASLATLFFNRNLMEAILTLQSDKRNIYINALDKNPVFDSRAFIIPENEINNYFIWRQEDASRNSIQGLAQSKFSHKELQGLKNNQLQDKLFHVFGINWNNIDTHLKRGFSCYKKLISLTNEGLTIYRRRNVLDTEIPIFKQDKDFITNIINESKNIDSTNNKQIENINTNKGELL